MIVFLASWGMMFAGLFFAYAFARSKAVAWPPPGSPHLPLALPALNTVVLGASSWTFARGLDALRAGRRSAFPVMVAVTLALGALFLGLQLAVFREVAAAGLSITSGTYGAVLYTFTAFHALHVAVGLAIVLWLLVQALRGRYTEHNTITVRLCTMYWHFVGVVWALMFLTIYVL
jgi:cytochrome c oxidase subunit 3